MFCKKCGAQNLDTAKFCKNCGEKLFKNQIFQQQISQPAFPRENWGARILYGIGGLIAIFLMRVLIVGFFEFISSVF